MFWLTSLQNTLFPFSLATYEESRVKKNTIYLENCSLISITHDATMHDARVERWLLFSTFLVFFKYPKKLDQDGYKAFFLCTSIFKHLFRLTKEKKNII